MDAFERIEAVVALEKPDRVPVAPLLDHWAATYTGISNAELMADSVKRMDAVEKTARDFKWDMSFGAETANPGLLRFGVPARLKLPGIDLPDKETHQFDEKGFMMPEDYDLLESEGNMAFMMAMFERIYPDGSLEDAGKELNEAFQESAVMADRLRKAGVVPAIGAFVSTGFETFCFARGINQGLMDVHRRPEKIKSAGSRLERERVEMALNLVELNGVKRVFIGLSRPSPAFISPATFEAIVLPSLESTINTLVEAGITPLLHCDTDWMRSLGYFKRFPKGKCILELDGFTDIFAAKEMLGDHMAIMGDVPSTLTARGTKDEVMAYCRRLIQEVGRDGGFILSTGCSLPNNARPENVAAITEAAHEFGNN